MVDATNMVAIVINTCYGLFGLSDEAISMLINMERISAKESHLFDDHKCRSDPDLVKVVQTLGSSANGIGAKLEIVYVPKGTRYIITHYDGIENVMTIDSFEWLVA